MPNNLTIRVGGDTGTTTGVISTGEMLTFAMARSQYDVFTFRTNPAESKGGQAMYQVRMGNHPVLSQGTFLDILIAYDEECLKTHAKDLKSDGLLIYDTDTFVPDDSYQEQSYGVPLSTVAQTVSGTKKSKNLVALGVVTEILGLPLESVKTVVKEQFRHKPEKVVEGNIKSLESGRAWALKNNILKDFHVRPRELKTSKVVMSGNEAMAAGAVYSGCRYYAGYPITPASEILEFLQKELPKFDGVAIQTEDEIAAITSCIGASFAGVKAMTATSGPGFSLMLEALGLSSMTEIPIVIVDCQRGGPSTGLPTKTEQSDLMQAIFGGHGEAPRVVMAPANVKDCFFGIIKAFNIAEKYQIPVLFLSDQSLSQRTQTYTRPKLTNIEVWNRLKASGSHANGDYLRYQMTDTGVSPIAVPGESPSPYVATGLEHNEHGDPNYTPANHFRMTVKRHKKLENIAKESGFTRRFGDEQAKVGILSWGSTEGPIEEAIHKANQSGYEVAALQVKMLHPLPDEEIKHFLKSVQHVIVPELNFTGQLSQIIRSKYLIPTIRLNKCAGMPFTPEEILNKIEEVIIKN
ncbi:MAG: 2-oxoacid:acceptor oxidoreductase subunit alpha [Elusimicrobia bacterium]|nr:2-oxoacid:acceptor oxidoreductase subunit alpha [Elusimicrobiota bacterium]